MNLRSLMLSLLVACGGAGGPVASPARGVTPTSADIQILFLGNSHTTLHNVPGLVTAMVRAGKPGKSVSTMEAPGWMILEERASDPGSLALLQSRRWDYVVLQAQALSQSGRFSYPTTGAEQLVRMSRQVGAVPVLFAEWPRAGVAESQTIYDTYVAIAMNEPACVAPIPQAFDLARRRAPAIALHADDGNHAAPAGAFLASLILAATITGVSPDTLPAIAGLDLDAEGQANLRGVATETVEAIAPRRWCPGDPPAR